MAIGIAAAGGTAAIITGVTSGLSALLPIILQGVQMIEKHNSGQPLDESDLKAAEALRRASVAAASAALTGA
jgi:hypothetical protein